MPSHLNSKAISLIKQKVCECEACFRGFFTDDEAVLALPDTEQRLIEALGEQGLQYEYCRFPADLYLMSQGLMALDTTYQAYWQQIPVFSFIEPHSHFPVHYAFCKSFNIPTLSRFDDLSEYNNFDYRDRDYQHKLISEFTCYLTTDDEVVPCLVCMAVHYEGTVELDCFVLSDDLHNPESECIESFSIPVPRLSLQQVKNMYWYCENSWFSGIEKLFVDMDSIYQSINDYIQKEEEYNLLKQMGHNGIKTNKKKLL